MNNSLQPNGNHINKDAITSDEEEKKEETKDEIVPGYDDDEEQQETPPTPSGVSKEQFRAKMIKSFGLIIIIFIVIILIGLIISLFAKKNYDYADVEDIMKNAAISYFKDNKNRLPKDNSQTVEIHASILTENEYMKPIEKYLGTTSCSGKVLVQKVDTKSFSYTSYIDCGKAYKTTEFYNAVINAKNIVTEGYGLYSLNNEYVYRGAEVKNYVKFSDSDILWRVVKITSSKEAVLILDDHLVNSFVWDNRYNEAAEGNDGINIYANSTMATVLDKIYSGTLNNEENEKLGIFDEETKILTKEDRTKTVSFNSCVANRSGSDTSKNGSSECSITYKTKISLLPVYDFLNASLDSNCINTESPSCQNYNYLTSDSSYWLANGKSELSSKVYVISGSNYIFPKTSEEEAYVRPVIHVGIDAMLQKGKGTKKNPFVIR